MVISSQEEVVNYSMKEGSVPGYIWDIFFFMEERGIEPGCHPTE